MKLRSIREIKDLKGKRVLLRADFNVPLKKESRIVVEDDFKIRRALPTIKYLIKNKAKVILVSHLGRPEGRVVEDLRLKPIYDLRPTTYDLRIDYYCQEIVGSGVKSTIDQMKEGEVVLLENLRFHSGEEKDDPAFAKELAQLANFFVNDAFASCHRNHTSIVGVTKYLPGYAGFNLEKEVETLSGLMKNPKRPLMVILGGAKIFTKIGVIKNFKKIADWILIGGALANNFLKAEGYEVGKSLIEKDKIREIEKLLENSRSKAGNYSYSFYADDCCLIGGEKIVLPGDVKVQEREHPNRLNGKIKTKKIDQIKKTDKILDIGPDTIKLFSEILSQAKTIFWNGPMGFFEDKKFALGTQKIAEAILKGKAQAVIGGGETVSNLKSQIVYPKSFAGAQDRLRERSNIKRQGVFISTGGGAMLEFLAGKELPGLKVLSK